MRPSDLYFSWWLRPGKTHFLTSGGVNRSYVVHVPKGFDPRNRMPAVLALHGATMNGPMMAWFCGLSEKAEEAGFLVVYPNGTGRFSSFTWNGGNCCGSALKQNVDDVAFIKALLDDLSASYSVDRDRIYATGISNGAGMTYRLAAELPDRIAAIAPIAGTMGTELGPLTRGLSVLHFHGTSDEFVPFAGGVGAKSLFGTPYRSVNDSIGAWVNSNGCAQNPTTDTLSKPGDKMKVTRNTFGGGRDGSEVVLVTIEGGGHTWPGRKSPAKHIGESALNISANDMMWEFFQRHPMSRLLSTGPIGVQDARSNGAGVETEVTTPA